VGDDSFLKAFEELHAIALAFETSGPLVAAQLDRNVRAFGLLIEADAKQRAPVDTGALRSSIGMDFTRDGSGDGYSATAVIGPTVNYGDHVELGTKFMAPQPYIGPAYDRYEPDFVAACNAAAIPKALQ
jgi:HK97 gp10 family phage protein